MTSSLIPDVLAPKAENRYRQKGNRCSTIGHPCPLTTWFARSALWEGRKPLDEGLLRIFSAGRAMETVVAPLLRGVGVIRQEEHLEWPELELAGSMDGLWPGPPITVEDLKSAAEHAFDGVDSVQDLATGTAYQRCYVPQVSLYASHPRVMAERGLLYFVAKSTHRVKQIVWDIGSALAQSELARCREACEAINTTLAEDSADASNAALNLANPGPWCDGCDWSHLCSAFTPAGCGWRLAPVDVAEKIEALQAIKEFVAASEKEQAKLEKALKLHWLANGAGQYVAGEWMATVKEVEAAKVEAFERKAYLRTTYKRLHKMESGEE